MVTQLCCRYIVNFSVYFTLFGVCVVLLLIASGNIQSLLQQVIMIIFSFFHVHCRSAVLYSSFFKFFFIRRTNSDYSRVVNGPRF